MQTFVSETHFFLTQSGAEIHIKEQLRELKVLATQYDIDFRSLVDEPSCPSLIKCEPHEIDYTLMENSGLLCAKSKGY